MSNLLKFLNSAAEGLGSDRAAPKGVMLLLAVQFSDSYYWFPTAEMPIKMLHFADGVHGHIVDIYDWFIKCCMHYIYLRSWKK